MAICSVQSDISAACAVVDSDFQPVLKPYQLVGVNFLLLLYRKGIGGGSFTILCHLAVISETLSLFIEFLQLNCVRM